MFDSGENALLKTCMLHLIPLQANYQTPKSYTLVIIKFMVMLISKMIIKNQNKL
jgi:hypothetical protein